MRYRSLFFSLSFSLGLLLFSGQLGAGAEEQGGSSGENDSLRIIVFGGHPDDAELDAGGVGARWAAQGHHVKFVSVTNGDIGHAKMAGGELARRRQAEVEAADEILGIEETEVLDIHDGELMPTLENRKKIVRLIREWKADVVISHRPNDYHPDHRYTGILVQDAAYMVIVTNFLPTVPALSQNPVFLYTEDGFKKPQPFEPDIVVPIDSVIDRKMKAIWQMESQIESLWATGGFEKIVPVPEDPEKRAERREAVEKQFKNRARHTADRFREELVELYGEERGNEIEFAEAFELCEYGDQVGSEELRALFPVSDK